jgi:tetratricopeptide (TPR) repeat protein
VDFTPEDFITGLIESLIADDPEISPEQIAMVVRSIAQMHGINIGTPQDSDEEDTEDDEGSELLVAAQQLREAYHTAGDLDYLVQAISLLRAALNHHPRGHSRRSENLDSLAGTLSYYCEQVDDIPKLLEAIGFFREAIDVLPAGNPNQPQLLANLATSLVIYYDRVGDESALVESIDLGRRAISTCPMQNPNRTQMISSLAQSLLKYATQVNDMVALNESISLYQEALSLSTAPNDRNRLLNLQGLSHALLVRFQRVGDLTLLAQAIELGRSSLEVIPKKHPQRAVLFNNLASYVKLHYEHSGNEVSLMEAIELHRQALELRPKGHPDRSSSLIGLATSLSRLFALSKNMGTLEESIALHREALELRPEGHPLRANALDGLITSLLEWCKHVEDMAAFQELIRLQDEVLKMRPMGHPGRALTLYNASHTFRALYGHTSDPSALEKSLKYMNEVLQERPVGHPRRHVAQLDAAILLLMNSPLFDWKTAKNYISLAVSDNNAPLRLRMHKTISALYALDRATIRSTDVWNPDESQCILDVFITVIRLLPRLAHFGLDLTTRLQELVGSEELCRIAALRATFLMQFSTAIELLEAGKGIFWSQALQLRSTSIDSLPSEDKTKLIEIFKLLEQDSQVEVRDQAELERRIEKRRLLNEEVEHLIDEIRTRPGFDRFLGIPGFDELCQAAGTGPIVMLVDTPFFSLTALIVNLAWPERVRALVIEGADIDQLLGFFSEDNLPNLRRANEAEAEENSERGMRITKRHQSLHAPLSKLWRMVVGPIVKALNLEVCHRDICPWTTYDC